LPGPAARVQALGLQPDGKRIVSAFDDRTMRVWDLSTTTWSLTEDFPASIRSFAFHPDDNVLAVGIDGGPRLIDATSLKFREWGGPECADCEVAAVAFDHSGSLFASALGATVHVTPLTGDEKPREFPSTAAERFLAFSDDGRLAMGGDAPSIRVMP